MPDDPLDDLARTLRQGVGDELRQEAAEDEALSELQRRRRASLADSVREAVHRGDRLVVTTAGLTLASPVTAVGSDYLVLDDGERVADVRLEGAVITVEPRSHGGHTAPADSRTWKARLAEHEQLGSDVEVVTHGGQRVSGVIEVSASDHIAIRAPEGTLSLVLAASVAVVFSRPPPGWR